MPVAVDTAMFRTVLEGLRTAVYVVDLEGRTLFWNDGAERITGYLRQDVVGRVCGESFLCEAEGEEEESTGGLRPIAAVIRDGKTIEAQISLRHKNGHRIPVQLRAFPIRNARGAIVGVAESFEETISVSDWDRRHTKLATYGCLDQASGVLNHGMVESHLRENLGMFVAHPVPFCILCVEIDHLDKIQARDGPGAIAATIRVVGQTLENSLRPTDFLGRWQEKQFFAVLTECNEWEIVRAADRLRRMASASKIEWWGDFIPVTISLGATSAKAGDTVEGIVARAMQALRWRASRGRMEGGIRRLRDGDDGVVHCAVANERQRENTKGSGGIFQGSDGYGE
jgi:diguanylate cyclase (GGDEF)-like protein/PAS domain S-box-containing protein